MAATNLEAPTGHNPDAVHVRAKQAFAADGRLLCGSCRKELLSEPSADALHLAQHAYRESHALLCCWRCMIGAVDSDDEVGLCRSCRGDR
jgi:hypothetical protein